MPWIKRKMRGNAVYVRATADGAPAADERGLVDIVYKLTADAKLYRASVRNLQPTGKADDERARDPGAGQSEPTGASTPPASPRSTKKNRSAPQAMPDDAVVIWTDGGCTGNPGPMGLGAVIIDGDQRQELSEYLGIGTNNIAELTAIERALETVPEPSRSRPVYVHSDSSYSIGLLTKGWKAKANVELVARLRALTRQFPQLHFVKVKGHAGIPENERCDELAGEAISRGR